MTTAPFGIIGSEFAFPLLYTKLVKTGKISLTELVQLMSQKPAELFKLPFGSLNIEDYGDISIWNLEEQWQINQENIISKGKNTPFLGTKVYGENQWTLVNGEVVWSSTKEEL